MLPAQYDHRNIFCDFPKRPKFYIWEGLLGVCFIGNDRQLVLVTECQNFLDVSFGEDSSHRARGVNNVHEFSFFVGEG